MNEVIGWFTSHVKELVGLLVVLSWVAAPLIQQRSRKRQQEQGKGPKPPARPKAGESDLERRVRKNFEELLRRSGQKPTPASPPQPTVAAPPAAPAASRPLERVPMPAPQAVDELDFEEETVPAPTTALPPPGRVPRVPLLARGAAYGVEQSHSLLAAPAAPTGFVTSGTGARGHKFDPRRLLLRHGPLDTGELRRALLLKEVLDAPRALAAFQGPPGSLPPVRR